MSSQTGTRKAYLAGFLVCLGLVGYALYLQHVKGQEPCPLCILQRIAFMALAVIFLVGALHNPRRRGAWLYSGLASIAAIIGGAIAGRQVWLQNLPKDQVPECGPGLEFMLEQFPLTRALEMVLKGSGECAEVGWRFLGLSIAGWSLVCFIALGVLAIVAAAVARGRRSRR
ncbi:MAG: disulfide bond formation protein B [Burkholderiales bacterium]|nr:disulfide bond formation protein B [Burkholderiales bacterium]